MGARIGFVIQASETCTGGEPLVAFIVNYDCSCEMVHANASRYQDIPRDPLFVMRACHEAKSLSKD